MADWSSRFGRVKWNVAIKIRIFRGWFPWRSSRRQTGQVSFGWSLWVHRVCAGQKSVCFWRRHRPILCADSARQTMDSLSKEDLPTWRHERRARVCDPRHLRHARSSAVYLINNRVDLHAWRWLKVNIARWDRWDRDASHRHSFAVRLIHKHCRFFDKPATWNIILISLFSVNCPYIKRGRSRVIS